jgi:hypothetical protein
MPLKSIFAIDWFDGVDWHFEVCSPTLKEALAVAANELRRAVGRHPNDRHVLRIEGPNTYIVLDSDPEKLHGH